ncbi:hypothetical protein ACWEPC_11575 [Nonomuraea sp. NPDC004297]
MAELARSLGLSRAAVHHRRARPAPSSSRTACRCPRSCPCSAR